MLEKVENQSLPFVILPLPLDTQLNFDDNIGDTVIFYRFEYDIEYKILKTVRPKAVVCELLNDISPDTFTVEDREEFSIQLKPIGAKSLDFISSTFRQLPRYALFNNPYYLLFNNEIIGVSKFYIDEDKIVVTEYCRSLLLTTKMRHFASDTCFFGKIDIFNVSSKNNYLYIKFVSNGAFLHDRMEEATEYRFSIIRPKVTCIPPSELKIFLKDRKCSFLFLPRDISNPSGAGIYPQDQIVPTEFLPSDKVIIRYKFPEIDKDWNETNQPILTFDVTKQTSKIFIEFVNKYKQTDYPIITLDLPITDNFYTNNFSIFFNLLLS